MTKRPALAVFSCLACLPAAVALAACAGGPEPTTPTSATTAEPPPPPTVVSQVPEMPPEDPRVVRCGVDDRPRSVVSTADDDLEAPEAQRGRRAARPAPEEGALFADRAAPEMKPRMPPQGERFEPEGPPIPPRIFIVREPPRPVSGGSLSAGVAQRLASSDPKYDVCSDLFAEVDLGRHPLEVSLSSTGAPLDVRSFGAGAPSRFLRCAMERACQVRAPAGEPVRVVLGLDVRRNAPPPPPVDPVVPVPPQPIAEIPVDVVLEGARAGDSDRLAVDLRSLFRKSAARCAAGRPMGQHQQVRFIVSLEGGPRNRRVATSRVGQIKTQSITPGVPVDLIGCVVNGVAGNAVGATAGAASITAVVTWNP